MFITLAEYKKRSDSIIKIAQVMEKAFDKNRFKNLLIQEIDKEIGDKTLDSLNNFRKNKGNLPPVTKEELKEIILRNIDYRGFFCNINELKSTIKKHADYCLKNTYLDLVDFIDEYWTDVLGLPDEFNNDEKYFINEKKNNPKKYYSTERNSLVEKAIKCLNDYNSDSRFKHTDCFVCTFATAISGTCVSGNFDKEIYGVRFYYNVNSDKTAKEVKAGFFKKELLPPNIEELIVGSVFEDEITSKIKDGYEKLREYGCIVAGEEREYWDYDYGPYRQLQLIDWVCDNSFRNSQK